MNREKLLYVIATWLIVLGIFFGFVNGYLLFFVFVGVGVAITNAIISQKDSSWKDY